MQSKNHKGILIHPCVRKYREGLFKRLYEDYGIDVLESDRPRSSSHVEKERSQVLERQTFRVLKRSRFSLPMIKNSNFSLVRALKKDYQLVVFSGMLSFPLLSMGLICKVLKKKVIVFDELWLYPTTKKYSILKFFLKMVAPLLVDRIWAASSKSERMWESFFKGKVPVTKVLNTHSEYCQLDLSQVRARKEKEILYLGRIVEIKGLDILLRSLKETHGFSLHVYGDGGFRQDCEEMAEYLGLGERVKFYGSVSHERALNLFREYKYFCLPSKEQKNSKQRAESWGFTVNEALSAGCICIVSDMVGCSEDLIKPGFNGYVFKSDDVKDLSMSLANAQNIRTSPLDISEDAQCRCSYDQNVRGIEQSMRGL